MTVPRMICAVAADLLPQSGEVRRLLESLVENPPDGFPLEAARELLGRLNFNA